MIFNQSGGTSLNFKVVKNPQPVNPSPNTIWLNTDRKINGYSFSATQPESMAEGEVWFVIGAVSNVSFSATKKNPVMVYPIFAKQKIDGVLVDVTAKSYQNGVWVDWLSGEEWLFDYGRERYDWQARAWGYGYGKAVEPTITRKNDGSVDITLQTSGSEGIGGAFELVENIDLTPYKTIETSIEYKQSGFLQASGGNAYILVINRKSSVWGNAAAVQVIMTPNTANPTLDVSNLSGFYDVAIALYSNSNAGNASHTANLKQMRML